MRNVLTIDVEEWFHTTVFSNKIVISDRKTLESRVEYNVVKLLEILDENSIKATFFVLGEVAFSHPELIKKIKKEKHEVACHGYGHKLIYTQTPDEFKNDIKKARDTISDIICEAVLGYRAPSWSITDKSQWAIDIIYELGFKYDSSIFPVKTYMYGIPDAPRFLYYLKSGLVEFPPSTHKLGKINIPIAGGTYLRLFPYRFTKYSISKLNNKGQSAMVYIHPWELDEVTPAIHLLAGKEKIIQYGNIKSTKKKLLKLLKGFQFTTIKNILKEKGMI